MVTASVSLDQALEATRTGDIWLFRGDSGPDRAIQTLTNSPVNHVGMTVAIDDLPPLIWHAELGDKLRRHVDRHPPPRCPAQRPARGGRQWMDKYGQRCWLRQLSPYANREQEDRALKVIARMDGTPFPSTARLTGRWFRGRLPTVSDWTRGIPLVHKRVRESAELDKQQRRAVGLETAYCAETVAITYDEMGLLTTEKRENYFDPGSFWSGDELPLIPGCELGKEISIIR